MPQEITPSRQGRGLHVGVVVARFNEFVTKRLLDGALEALTSHEVAGDDIDVVWVPGSFEIATAAMTMARSGRYNAIVCIGAVIRGETAHFDYVSSAVTRGVGQVNLETGVPTVFGVLTTDTVEQALVRSGAVDSNRGYDAGVAAIEMVDVLRRIG